MSIKKSELANRIYLVKRGKRKGRLTTALAAVLVVAMIPFTYTGVKAETKPEVETRLKQETSEAESQQRKEASLDTDEQLTESVINARTEKNTVRAMGTLYMESTELTMEKLIDSYNNRELFEWTVKDISKYPNVLKTSQNDSRCNYEVDLSYQGIDYWMELAFYKEKIGMVKLKNEETGEWIYVLHTIYADYQISPEAFVHREKILDEKISYTLPKGLLETEDRCHYGRAGRMFCSEEKEKYGIYGTYGGCLWNTTGGLMQALLMFRKEEKTVDFRFIDFVGAKKSQDRRTAIKETAVREFRGGGLQNIDGCENVISLQGLYIPEDAIKEYGMIRFNGEETGKVTKKEMKQTLADRKLWILCVIDEKNRKEREALGYVFFFDAEIYTKKQMIAFAKSVHLK